MSDNIRPKFVAGTIAPFTQEEDIMARERIEKNVDDCIQNRVLLCTKETVDNLMNELRPRIGAEIPTGFREVLIKNSKASDERKEGEGEMMQEPTKKWKMEASSDLQRRICFHGNAKDSQGWLKDTSVSTTASKDRVSISSQSLLSKDGSVQESPDLLNDVEVCSKRITFESMIAGDADVNKERQGVFHRSEKRVKLSFCSPDKKRAKDRLRVMSSNKRSKGITERDGKQSFLEFYAESQIAAKKADMSKIKHSRSDLKFLNKVKAPIIKMNVKPSAAKGVESNERRLEEESINTGGDAVFVTNLPHCFDAGIFRFLCPRVTQIQVGTAKKSVFLVFPDNETATNACTRLNLTIPKRCVAKVVKKDGTDFYHQNEDYLLSRNIELGAKDLSDECRCIIVFNISSLTSEEELALHFLSYGLETVNIFGNLRERFAILGFSSHTGATTGLACHRSTIAERLNYIEVYRCSTLNLFMVPSDKVVEAYAAVKLNTTIFMKKY